MNPLRLIRTSTFQLAWWYMGVFGGSALILIGVVWWATVGYLEEQTMAALNEEIQTLEIEYQQRELPGLARAVTQRMSKDNENSTLYLIVDRNSRPMVGNVGRWPVQRPDSQGLYGLVRTQPDGQQVSYLGRVLPLRDGMRLLVAQNQSRLEATRSLINDTFLWALGGGLILALIGGFVMSSSVLRRIEAINRASREIMKGRLQRRMPVRGVGDEFDQLSENLNVMLDRIDSLINGVKSVADNIAHDLRTPLTRLRGRLENLSSRPGLDEDLRDELSFAMTEADDLLSTFRALLRISRIESGTRDSERADLDLPQLLEDAWELYQAVGDEKGIVVRLGTAPNQVRGDRDLLFQALCNLLDNAVKYSPAGSVVSIEASETADSVAISISDNGSGIPEEERDKVLGRFYRTGTATGAPGSGLGLALVNAIANYHDGKLILSDNLPGLRATLRLPKATALAAVPTPEVTFTGAGQ